MNKFLNLIWIICIFLTAASCSISDAEKSELANSLLPPASGAPGEIIISMDSSQWKGDLGELVRDIFMAEVQGLPREETIFNLRYILPENLSNNLKQVSNLLFVTSFDSKSRSSRELQEYFTDEFINETLKTDEKYVVTMNDVFAKNQAVMYLFGRNQGELIDNLKENRQQLIDYFNRK